MSLINSPSGLGSSRLRNLENLISSFALDSTGCCGSRSLRGSILSIV